MSPFPDGKSSRLNFKPLANVIPGGFLANIRRIVAAEHHLLRIQDAACDVHSVALINAAWPYPAIIKLAAISSGDSIADRGHLTFGA